MKVFIVLAAACIAVASAGKVHYGAGPAVLAAAGPALGAVSTGTSSQFRSEDNYGNYNFGYDESHATGSTSRREESSNGVRRGSYSLSDADGRRRVVNYIADEHGFRASVQTNEPGVEPKDPADVLINKEAPVAVVREVAAPAPVYAAPAAPLPAPVYAAPAAPLPAPVPVYAAAPAAPVAVAAPVKGYGYAAPRLAAVAPVVVEAPTPRAFSYSFGSTHLAPAAPVAYGPAPVAAPLPAPLPAPIYQQQLAYPQQQQQQLDY